MADPGTMPRVLLSALLFCCYGAGCRDHRLEPARPDPGPALDAISLDGLALTPSDTDRVFQYFDPATGRPSVVTDPAAVPEAQRSHVMVLFSGSRRDRLPARALVLADLTRPRPDGSFPVRVVDRWEDRSAGTLPDAAKPAPAAAASEVVLYTSPGCPHCRHARDWLTRQQVPFVEKDVSADSAAADEIQALGRQQGIPEAYLSSVPLLLVKGRVLVGFDPAQVQAALGGA